MLFTSLYRFAVSATLSVGLATAGYADQFVIFDKTFLFEEKDAIPTKSHITVEGSELNRSTPKNWNAPVNYVEGNVHVLIDVIEKPEGDAPTFWSICYIGNEGQNGSRYACVNSPTYTKRGSYKVLRDMNKLWQKDTVVWTKGLKKMTLVMKGPRVEGGQKGKSHAHLQPDLKKFFPTKIRFRIVQIEKGDAFDQSTLTK